MPCDGSGRPTSPLGRPHVKPLVRIVLVAVAAFLVMAGVIVDAGSATPRLLPKTLAEARPAGVGVVVSGFPIDFVAAVWSESAHAVHGEAEHGVAEVRFRTAKTWGPWVSMGEDGAQAEHQFGTALVPADDADA